VLFNQIDLPSTTDQIYMKNGLKTLYIIIHQLSLLRCFYNVNQAIRIAC
jgi:hypothetical protein